jgi:Tfp pilus assembly protein PilW
MPINPLTLITEPFRNDIAEDIIDSIGDSTYFIFAGYHTSYPNNDVNIVQPTDAKGMLVDTYQNMIFGKTVTNNDVIIVAQRYDWTSNTIYTMYDDQDANLFNENFYVAVNATSTYNIFKCLYNNGNTPSTVVPADLSSVDASFTTSDGYIWKYLYTVDATTFNKFATPNFMPIIANANTTANTISGALDVIAVITPGSGYNNYLSGQFNANNVQISGNSILYGIDNSASSVNGYYNQCILYIIDGTGKGQFKQIVNYQVIGLSKQVTLSSAFANAVDATSSYAISPYVSIVGDSSVTINAVARAIVNSAAANSIYQIDVLSRGSGYRLSSANIVSDVTVGVTNTAILRVIIPPVGGHGAHVTTELGGTCLGISIKFVNSESSTIPTQNDYRTVGVIRDPLWANIQLSLLNSANNPGTNGQFIFKETVYEFRNIQLQGTVGAVNANNQVIGTGTDFANQVNTGDYVYISGDASWFGKIVGISDQTLVLDSNLTFTNAVANISLANVISSGIVVDIAVGTINISNVNIPMQPGMLVIGSNSFAIGKIGSYTINGINKNFNTFTQCNRYYGILNSGTFANDEVVYQGNLSISNAAFHSIDTSANGVLVVFTTQQSGQFFDGGTIVGSNSGAIFTITSQIPGDIMLDSGEILYIRNGPAIARSNSQNEAVNIVLKF